MTLNTIVLFKGREMLLEHIKSMNLDVEVSVDLFEDKLNLNFRDDNRNLSLELIDFIRKDGEDPESILDIINEKNLLSLTEWNVMGTLRVL